MTVGTVFFLSIIAVGDAITWSPHSLPDQTEVTSCQGDTVTLTWSYRLGVGEAVEDVKWHYSEQQQGDQHQQLVAMDTEGLFLPSPTLPQHLQVTLDDNAGLTLSHVTTANSGWYWVTVGSHDGARYMTSSRTAHVTVADPPTLSGGQLTVGDGADKAVFDNITRDWHVQLACGTLVYTGLPPVTVEWLTPAGIVNSSYSTDDHFYLLLENPVKGGNYTCRLPPDSPAAACYRSWDPLLVGSTVLVDETKARFTLLEARQAQLVAENEVLKGESTRLQEALVLEKGRVDDLQQHMADVEACQRDICGQLTKDSAGSGTGPYADDHLTDTTELSTAGSVQESDIKEMTNDDLLPL